MSYRRFVRRAATQRRVFVAGLLLTAGFALANPEPMAAQWSTTYEQWYLPGKYNWAFRRDYPAADRLFNAFDFGHAILYETLWTDFDDSVEQLEQRWYNQLTKRILVSPPRLPLEEAAIEPTYARLAPEAKVMFDWAHLMHRQVYDVWADESMTPSEKDAMVAELLRYYKSRPDLAFSSKPKSMVLMQEQPYSLAFRKGYPKFNGLIWAYHWLQVGLYEPLVTGRNVDERQLGVRAAVARFWQMLQDPPRTMPYVMPMTAAVAPEFAKRYPEAAIIFDNLHSMHDVVSDILANPKVPRDRKRAEILLAARRYRDDTSFVMTEQAWRTMAQHMGVENMGGVAKSALPSLPTPTVTYGAVMTHDDRTGEMTGFKYGQATGGAHAGMQHGATPSDTTRMPAMDHSRMTQARDSQARQPDTSATRREGQQMRDAAGRQPDSSAKQHEGHQLIDTTRRAAPDSAEQHTEAMIDLHMRLLSNPVIRAEILADTVLRRMMRQMTDEMMREIFAERRGQMERLMNEPAPRTRPAAPSQRPAARPADPHAGHQAPPAKPAPSKKPTPANPPAKTDPHAEHQMPPPKAAPPKPAAVKPPAKKDSMPGTDHSKMPGVKKP